MTIHAKDPLRCTRISEIFNLPLAVPTLKAIGTEGLVACQNGEILYLVAAAVAAICTVVADQRAIAEQEEVRIRVEQGLASITPEAIDVPPIASYALLELNTHA